MSAAGVLAASWNALMDGLLHLKLFLSFKFSTFLIKSIIRPQRAFLHPHQEVIHTPINEIVGKIHLILCKFHEKIYANFMQILCKFYANLCKFFLKFIKKWNKEVHQSMKLFGKLYLILCKFMEHIKEVRSEIRSPGRNRGVSDQKWPRCLVIFSTNFKIRAAPDEEKRLGDTVLHKGFN